MFNFLKLLGKLNRISGATDNLIHSENEEIRKAAIVTIVMSALEIAEDKMKLDFADDELVKSAATHLSNTIFSVIHSIKDND